MSAFDVDVDAGSPVPLYHQIANQLEEQLQRGAIARGDFLPSEIDLAQSWGVSRPTARKAIAQLVDKGLVVRRRGVGTRVIGTEVRRPVRLSSLFDDLVAGGRTPQTVVLLVEEEPAGEEVAEALGIDVGTPVLHVVRLREVDGEPIAYMRNWVLDAVAAGIGAEDLNARGLYDLLRDRDVRPSSASQVIGAGAARKDEARHLHLPVGAPVLYMHRTMRDDRGRAVELGKHVYNPELYQLTVDLEV